MFEVIESLPSSIIGVKGGGKITSSDYDSILLPLIDQKAREGNKIRFLYHDTPSFNGITPQAIFKDATVGVKSLSSFEKMAVVTDRRWFQKLVNMSASLFPYPMAVFRNRDYKKAITWLNEEAETKDVYLNHEGVVIFSPSGTLEKDDFIELEKTIEPLLKVHQKLSGLVIELETFPGWKDVGSFIHHLQFVIQHQKKISRLAFATDSSVAPYVVKILERILAPDVRLFAFGDKRQAALWAGDEG